MSLISGKEALIALANGENVEVLSEEDTWVNAEGMNVKDFIGEDFSFRLKPRTISINNIEVPAPFKPEVGNDYWFLTTKYDQGYDFLSNSTGKRDSHLSQFGAWKTKDEIKQVVSALRSIFNK